MVEAKVDCQIIPASTAAQIETIRSLFLEYAQSLDFKLCFQSFDEELAGLPGKYAEPEGRLLLASVEGEPAGCVAVRRIDDAVCEMKRLWVRPAFRGRKIGEALARRAMEEARCRYGRMRLDTVVSSMAQAVKLYRALGFYEIEAYTHNPVAGAMFMECELKG
jgi:ribosomal protein S18 acetylase RimI-like enzyme